jgi:P-type Ca2+ transporter type 2C
MNSIAVLSAVQLLWVNLIMDTFAALALASDPPNEKILWRKPNRKSAPLITLTMWKMIIGQAIYQTTITLIMYFGGPAVMHQSYSEIGTKKMRRMETIVFNTFVWMQIFNLWR